MPDTDRTDKGITIVMNGQRYFLYGKNRIKITEHFPEGGKNLDELIVKLICNEIQEKSRN